MKDSDKQVPGTQPTSFDRRSVMTGTAALAVASSRVGAKEATASEVAHKDRAVSIGQPIQDADIADAFERATARCRSTGVRRIDFPAGRYRTTRPLVIDIEGLTVAGADTTLVQASQGPSMFELVANDAKIFGFRVVGAYQRMPAVNSGDAYRRDCGIACYNCHRYEIRDVAVRNFQAGIYASGWRTGGADGRGTGVFQVGGLIRDVAFDACDFGLIYGVQHHFFVENLSCRNTTKVAGYEPHAIYATNAFGTERTDNEASDAAGLGGSGHVRIVNASSDRNLFDSCFKFKAHRKLVVSGLYGRDARILVQFTGCPDLEAGNLTLERQRAWLNDTGRDIVWLDDSGKTRQSTALGRPYARTAQAVALGFCDRARLSAVTVDQMSGYDGLALKLSFSSSVIVEGLTVRTMRSNRRGDHVIVLNDGSDHAVFRNFVYRDFGGGDEEVFCFSDSSDGLVDRPDILGSIRYGIMVGHASRNRVIVAPAAKINSKTFWRTNGDGQDNEVVVSPMP